jgi:hypothetical protein
MSLTTLQLPTAPSDRREEPQLASRLNRVFDMPVLFGCVLAAVVYLSVPRIFQDPDIGWHLRDAEILINTHHFIRYDLFSYTAAGAPWMNHEWLAELPFYAAWRLGGSQGLHVITLLIIEMIMFGVFGLALCRSRNVIASVVLTVLGTLLATVSFGPRTLLFGWIFLLVELAILELSIARSRYLWLLPFLFAVWVNTHGSWMIGLVVYALVVAGRALSLETPYLVSPGFSAKQLRIYIAAGILSMASLFLNPYGWRLVAYPFNLAFHQKLNIATVAEWQTLDLHTPRGKLALGCILVLGVWQLVRPSKWQLSDLLLLIVGIYSGFTYSRFLFLTALLAVPIVAGTLCSMDTLRSKRVTRPLLNSAVILLLATLVFTRAHFAHGPDPRAGRPIPETFPAALGKLPPEAHVFNEYNWGGRLIWQQRIPVFIDSRVDIFEYNGTLRDYLDIVHLNRTQELLDQHQINYVLFQTDSSLVYFLKHTGKWLLVAQKGDVALLSRR